MTLIITYLYGPETGQISYHWVNLLLAYNDVVSFFLDTSYLETRRNMQVVIEILA